MKIVIRTVAAALILGIGTVQGGAVEAPDSITAGVAFGRVLPSNDFVRREGPAGQAIDRIVSGRLEIGWQTRATDPWEEAYNFPSYGFGLQGAGYNDGGQIGNPVGGYGFFGVPLFRGNGVTVNSHWALGIAGNFNRFNAIDNPNNIAIGAPVAFLLDIGANLQIALTRRLDLGMGATFTHYSNGGVQQPNQGLNSLAPLLQLTYYLRERPVLPRRLVPRYSSNWECVTQGWGGWGSLGAFHAESGAVTRFPTRNFPAAGLTALLNRQFAWTSKVGAGVDLTYDDAHTHQVNLDGSVTEMGGSFWDKSSLGLFGGYEQVVYRLSVMVAVGYDVLRSPIPGQVPRLYEKIGVKYHFFPNVFLGFNVRLHDFQQTQRIEFILGKRWKL